MAGELIVSTINGAGFDGGNVVINPEFTVNQRGAASRTATSSAYNFDRWYYDGTNLLQGIEGNNLRAGTYVISWEGSSTAAFSLNTAAAGSQGGQSYTSVTNGGTITIASVGSNNLWLKFTGDLTNLTKVKVSPGTEASGFVARPYGTELALCQRYYERIESTNGNGPSFVAFVNGSTSIDGMFVWKVQKRAVPTVTGSTGSNLFNGEIGSTSYATGGFTSAFQMSEQGSRVRAVSTTSLSNGQAGYMNMKTGGFVAASAEL